MVRRRRSNIEHFQSLWSKRLREKRQRLKTRKPRGAVGFYTDGEGRVRPITPNVGHGKSRRNVIGKNILKGPPRLVRSPTTKIGETLLKQILTSILYQAPFVREVYSVYLISSAIYTNWDLIRRCYESYRKNGLVGVSKTLGREIAFVGLYSAQSNITWSITSKFVPEDYSDESKNALSMLMDEITEEELHYVERFLK